MSVILCSVAGGCLHPSVRGAPPARRAAAISRASTLVLAAVGLATVAVAAPLPVAAAAEINGLAVPGESAKPTEVAAAGHCLSRQEQRARTAARTVVSLATAMRAVRRRGDDLLHARLCERDGRLVYLLTVLSRGGKVVRASVDAGSGALIGTPR